MNKGNKSNKRDKGEKGYHRLVVWQRAHELAILIYRKTRLFPKSELYGLTSQLRRAALSVPANIVEGYSRKSKKEFLRFLGIARGSLSECEYFLEFARELKFFTKENYEALGKLRGEVGYLLHRFTSRLRT